MSAAAKYTLGRVGLFLAVLLVLLPVPMTFLSAQTALLLRLMLAVLVSAVLAFFLLRGWRDEMAAELAARSARRKAEKDRLRAALSGEDEPEQRDPPK